MIWKTSMDRLHKSLDRKLLNKVAQALDQIRELDDVVFDTNRNQNTFGKSISIKEIELYEKMLISQKIIPKDKGHYVHRILYSEYCYRLPKQQKKIRYGVYGIYVNNELQGEIVKEFTFLKPKFHITFGGYTVTGDFFNWDYDVFRNDTRIATINKEIFKFRDTYTINVNESDALLVLMIVLSIDSIKERQNSSHN